MNPHSFICQFIATHPEDWEGSLRHTLDLRIKREGALAIFNYNIIADFHNPIVQEARGIIIDTERLEVVCWPFRKFGNHTEGYADDIDWEHARVLEKVDGSLIKLWYDHAAKKWQFSTNGTIRSENAGVDGAIGLTFFDVIQRADNFGDIPFDRLDRDSTYIFELVSPETKVIIDYGVTTLYHLGTRSNLTGEERYEDIGIKMPASYPITSLADCVAAATALNRTEGGSGAVTHEGFVVVDDRYHRVKVKSPDYIVMHRLNLSGHIPKQDCLILLLSGRENIDLYLSANPDLIPTIKFYDYKLAELFLSADRLGEMARRLFDEYSGDRGAVARIINRHPLAAIAFRCLTRPESGSEILRSMPIERITKLIPTYEQEDLSTLFIEDAEG